MNSARLQTTLSERERACFLPPESLTISEWAEKYRVLVEPAEEKGPLRLRRTPYLAPIMNAFQDPEIEEVVVCKSAQIAGTEGMLSVIGYYAHQEGAPIMIVLADEDTAKYMSRERIQPMFRAPGLSSIVNESTMGTIEISLRNGAYLAMGWASSVAKLASRPIRIMILDEVDKDGYSVSTKEAGPISLARERTETFYAWKLGILSTPTDEFGNIARELEKCDAVFDWRVPCPHCGQMQPLVWSRKYAWGFEDGRYLGLDGDLHDLGGVIWEGGRKATTEQIDAAGYQCGECGAVWNTLEKNLAVERGTPGPRAQVPDKLRKVGFHVWRLYSLLGKSGEIPKLVRAYIGAVKSHDPKDLQGFVNSTLAQPFKSVVSAKSYGDLAQCRADYEPQIVPPEVIALTCGIDVQKYGFWFVVRGWARDFSSWLIHYGQLATWDDVEHLLFAASYPVYGGHGGSMRIWRAGIDTGGGDRDSKKASGDVSMTEETYMWVRRNGVGRGCRVWGTKGSSSPLRGKVHLGNAMDKYPSGKPIPGGLQLLFIDTHQVKDAIHYRLDQAKQHLPMGCYLHCSTGNDYYSHILAEEKRRNNKRNIEEWVQVKPDNHLLDCEVIALAVADPECPGGGVQLLNAPVLCGGGLGEGAAAGGAGQLQRKPPVTIRSKWMGGR